jgi:hypothetical protein
VLLLEYTAAMNSSANEKVLQGWNRLWTLERK